MASESPWAISGVESYYNLSHLMLTELLCVETQGVAVKWPKHMRACDFGEKIGWDASVFGNFQFLSLFTFSKISFSKISFSNSSIVSAIRWNYFCSLSNSLKLMNRWSHFDGVPWKRSQTACQSQQTSHTLGGTAPPEHTNKRRRAILVKSDT